jgi:hypothetical protein
LPAKVDDRVGLHGYRRVCAHLERQHHLQQVALRGPLFGGFEGFRGADAQRVALQSSV